MGTYQETSYTQLVREQSAKKLAEAQLAEPLWTDPGLRSEISVRDLISTLMNCRTFTQNPRTRGKSHQKKATRPTLSETAIQMDFDGYNKLINNGNKKDKKKGKVKQDIVRARMDCSEKSLPA